jgi:hypothetical protein
MSSSELDLDLSSSSGGSEQEGGNPMNDIMSIASVASSCTLCVIFFVLIGVISNKNYCK